MPWKYKLYNVVGTEVHTEQHECKNEVPETRNLVLFHSKPGDLEQIFNELSAVLVPYRKDGS